MVSTTGEVVQILHAKTNLAIPNEILGWSTPRIMPHITHHITPQVLTCVCQGQTGFIRLRDEPV
ncbi:MAG: hypothetical protein IH585_12560 [Anaerolineaceae bacterium]|nr:hypothetical protein [Anaerolineaceae bacterium]